MDERPDVLAMLHERPSVSAHVAADLLGVAPGTVYRWIREGDLPAVRIGAKTVRVRSADLLALLAPEVVR